jgi:hypothetical protein
VVVTVDFFWLDLLLEVLLALNEKAEAVWARAVIKLASRQIIQILDKFRLRNVLPLKDFIVLWFTV